jgi:hypothetical protein
MKKEVKLYIDSGFACLPTKDNKQPFCSESWNKGISDLSKYEGCYGIGIICGEVSGGLECLDFDNHFGDAKETLKQFIEILEIKELYNKYNFPIESTVNGGYHLLYRCDKTEGNQKLAQRPKKNEQDKWIPDTIIETRGNNGYFVCDPTPGYKIIKNNILQIGRISIEERQLIIDICKSFNEWVKPVQNEFEQNDKPGEVYNKLPESIDEMKTLLIQNGWKELNKFQWSRPGKKTGISATLGKVAPNVFYVFSANAFPFDENHGYTPFTVKSLLEYNGNFKECAKGLAEKLGLNNKSGNKKEYKNPEKSIDEKRAILNKAIINTDIEIEKPPVIIYISDSSAGMSTRKRLFTLGNFSAIIGKAKSRKTFNLSMFTASLVRNGNLYNKFYGCLPDNKRHVFYFDTEQGLYDSANTIKRIERVSNVKNEFLGGFNIREYTPLERCDIIEYALSISGHVGFVAIDGIADLANAINDEIEASRVTGLLMRWTKQYNCHICTVIHQNKNDNFATGHLGSSVMKKAEIVISVSKEKGSQNHSLVSCDYSRSIDFDDFSFYINDIGLPVLSDPILNDEPIDKWYD